MWEGPSRWQACTQGEWPAPWWGAAVVGYRRGGVPPWWGAGEAPPSGLVLLGRFCVSPGFPAGSARPSLLAACLALSPWQTFPLPNREPPIGLCLPGMAGMLAVAEAALEPLAVRCDAAFWKGLYSPLPILTIRSVTFFKCYCVCHIRAGMDGSAERAAAHKGGCPGSGLACDLPHAHMVPSHGNGFIPGLVPPGKDGPRGAGGSEAGSAVGRGRGGLLALDHLPGLDTPFPSVPWVDGRPPVLLLVSRVSQETEATARRRSSPCRTWRS